MNISITKNKKRSKNCITFIAVLLFTAAGNLYAQTTWQSAFVQLQPDNSLHYTPDENGNTIPDFSRVGYRTGNVEIPKVPVVKTLTAVDGYCDELIQSAIDEVSKMKLDKNGFRGAILLKKGVYKIKGTLNIAASGIVLYGEGDDITGTRIIATGTEQHILIKVLGSGNPKEVPGTRMKITDAFVPVGAFSFHVENAKKNSVGERIIVYRPATDNWIHDLKMDQIEPGNDTKQWEVKDFGLSFERTVTKVEGNTVFIDNPIVMQIETKYGGGEIYQYTFNGRIENVGIEKLYLESEYLSDTAENHGWDAVNIDKAENGWVKNVTAR